LQLQSAWRAAVGDLDDEALEASDDVLAMLVFNDCGL
jgi:hypothetical protein